jgi:enamine deaminase RidA (YjgF/YER057c/UK114 family)
MLKHCAKHKSKFIRQVHIEARIAKLGYVLPVYPASPRGNYITYVRSGKLLFLSGHLPQIVGEPLITGRLGENMSIEEGQRAARIAGLQLLATAKEACPNKDLDRIKKVIKLTGFVNSTNEFTSQATVMNGCSDLFGEVFGIEVGQHSRSAIGVNVLPLGVPIEIEAVLELDTDSLGE